MKEQMHSSSSATKAIYGRKIEAVHCLLIPIYGESLLLPNAAVAEVVAYTDVVPVDNAPEWFLGYMNWRDLRIPLISFEAASGGEVAPLQKNSRIAVLNTLNHNQQLSHFGIVTQGIPHLHVVQEKNISRDEKPAEHRTSIADYIQLEEETVLVPDLDNLEERLQQLQTM
jgi:chemosensory pili system protein ChpC